MQPSAVSNPIWVLRGSILESKPTLIVKRIGLPLENGKMNRDSRFPILKNRHSTEAAVLWSVVNVDLVPRLPQRESVSLPPTTAHSTRSERDG